MSSELKPCPACGGAGLYYCGTSGAFYIPCTDCTFVGQPGVAPNEAARLWNALPRELEWGSDPPKVPGGYLCIDHEGYREFYEIGTHSTREGLWAFNESHGDEYPLSDFKLFYGPIPEPKGGAE